MNHILDAFSESRRWSKFVGIILAILLVIQLIGVSVNFFSAATELGGIVGIISILLSLVLVGVNLFASISLIRYAGSVKDAEIAPDPTEDIERACLHQGRYFKYVSIAMLLTIIMTISIIVTVAIPAYQAYL